jgi:hypothetical protein
VHGIGNFLKAQRAIQHIHVILRDTATGTIQVLLELELLRAQGKLRWLTPKQTSKPVRPLGHISYGACSVFRSKQHLPIIPLVLAEVRFDQVNLLLHLVCLLFGCDDSLVRSPGSMQPCQSHRIHLTTTMLLTPTIMHPSTRLLQSSLGRPTFCIKPGLVTASPGDKNSSPTPTCTRHTAHHVNKL